MDNLEDSEDVEGGWGETVVRLSVPEEDDEVADQDSDATNLGWKRTFHLLFQPIWSYSILIIAVVEIYLAIYQAGFRRYGKPDGLISFDDTVVKYICITMYIIDILLTIGCKTLHGIKISPSEISRPNWVLIADFISIIPVQYFIPMNPPVSSFKERLYYVIQLTKCLKLARVGHMFYYIHNSVGTSKIHLQVFEFYFLTGLAIIIGFVMTYHVLCYTTPCGDVPTPTEYFNYFYVSVCKISARGITVYPNDTLWRLCTCILSYVVFMFIICGSIANVMIAVFTLLHHKYEFLTKLNLVRKFFEEFNVPPDIYNKAMEFYDSFWNNQTGYDNSNHSFELLPQSLCEEITLDISWYALKHSKLLRSLDIPFLRHASVFVKSEYYLPGEILFSKNDNKDKMIYVVSGVIQILSDEDDETPILSFSAGTTLGESSLILNYKPKVTVRCKTFCNIHMLEARDFTILLKTFPEHFKKMRKSFQARLLSAQKYQDISERVNSSFGVHDRTDYITIIWLKTTLHKLMMKDGVTTSRHQCQNVFLRDQFSEERFTNRLFTAKHLDMLAISERLELINDTVFLKTSCPCVFQPDSVILKTWNTFLVILAIITAVVVPYFAFVEPETPIWYEAWIQMITVMWLLDLYIQCSTGIKTSEDVIATVKTIFLARMKTMPFLVDMFAALPLAFLSSIILWKVTTQRQAGLHLNRIIKIWRVQTAFFKPKNQMGVNLILICYFKYCSILLYTAYFFACILYSVNCFDHICSFVILDTSKVMALVWCIQSTINILTGVCIAARLTDKRMYYPTFLIINLVSTAFQIFICGSLAAGYALRRLNRIELQEIMHDIGVVLKSNQLKKYDDRINEFMHTQWEHNNAVIMIYKVSPFRQLPSYLFGELRESTLSEFISTTPMFLQLPEDMILDICVAVKIVARPPNEVISYAGDICNALYIIEKGFCKVVCGSSEVQHSVIGAQNTLYAIESSLRVPAVYTVVTVTHCRLAMLENEALNLVYLKYPLHKEELDKALFESNLEKELAKLYVANLFSSNYKVTIKSKENKTFHEFGYHIPVDSFQEYDYYVPFDRLHFFSFVQYLLLRYTILPESKFLFWWEVGRSTFAIFSAILFCITEIGTCTECKWYFILALLDGMAWIDIYVRLHICYYNENGILITHPLRTAIHYIKGAFLIDIVAVFPAHFFFASSNRYHNQILSLMQLNRILQMYRYIGLFQYMQEKTFLPTRVLPIIKYFPIILILAVCTGSGLTNLVCKFDTNIDPSPDGTFTKGVKCLDKSWINSQSLHKPLTPLRVQAYGIYFATSIFTTCGMMGFYIRNSITAILFIPLSTGAYGLFAHLISTALAHYTCGNSTLLRYQDAIKSLRSFMKSYHVQSSFQEKLIAHYELKWYRKLGYNVHYSISTYSLSLQLDILYDIYGTILHDASVFTIDSKSFLRNLLLEVSHDFNLRNTLITGINDVTKKTHIILKGKATVVAPDGTHLAILMPGSMFGNLDDIDMTRQTVSVIATGHVETLSIDSIQFYRIIHNYPQIHKRYKYLTALHIDYIKGRGNVTDEDEATQDNNRRSSKVFYPESKFIKVWNLLTLLLVCHLEVKCTLYQMAMAEYHMVLIIFQYACDAIYIVNVYVKFHTAYRNKVGTIVTELSMIRNRILSDRFMFFYAIISVIPFDVVAWFLPSSTFFYLHPILRLNRLLRAYYVIQYFREQKEKVDINLLLMRSIYVILWSTFLLHAMTCVLILVSCTHSPSMHPKMECHARWSFHPMVRFREYIQYYYVIMSCFVHSSQESAYPQSFYITVFCIFLMIFLHLLSITFLAQIYSTFQKLYFRQNRYATRLERIRNMMEREQLSPSLSAKAYDYLRFLWRKKRGVVYPKLLLNAPPHLMQPIVNSAFGHHINNHYIFVKCHVDFNRQLVACLRTKTYFPDDYIVLKGTISKSMYFIHKGSVAVLSDDGAFKEVILETLKPGMSFGVTQGLFPHKAYSHTFRAIKTTEILVLYLDMWQHLLRFFPASKAVIMKHYEVYGDRWE